MSRSRELRKTKGILRGAITAVALAVTVALVPVAAANPAAATSGADYWKSREKAEKKPYSAHCWKHWDKYWDREFWFGIRCELAKKYEDFEVVNLTGPHYDSETGRAKPGPALRDIQITTPSLFGKTEVLVLSLYNLDKDNDGTSERHELVSKKYFLNGGESLTVRVPIAPNDPKCGGHDISVRMKDVKTKRRVGDGFQGLNSPEGVDINNPPPIERIG